MKMMLLKERLPEILTPNGTSQLEEVIGNDGKSPVNYTLFMNSLYLNKLRKNYTQGKSNLGIAALHNAHHALSQLAGLEFYPLDDLSFEGYKRTTAFSEAAT